MKTLTVILILIVCRNNNNNIVHYSEGINREIINSNNYPLIRYENMKKKNYLHVRVIDIQ
jgi:hypothetical protein